MDATVAATSTGPRAGPADIVTSTTGTVPAARTAARVGELPCVWVLPHRPESVGTARRLTRTALNEWGIDDDTADQALLVVSELVTNAIEHARPPVALHLDRPTPDGTLHIEVDDGGPATHSGAWSSSCTDDEHGRGNTVIDFLTTAHGTRATADGAIHWADLPTAA